MAILKRFRLAFAVFLLFGMVFPVFSRAEEMTLKPVPPNEICMVNNSVMGETQIPVLVEGKTYYGCCEGCVGRLKDDRSLRYAKDPVTGNEVDKATAFIIPGEKGNALYFESMETALKFKSGK